MPDPRQPTALPPAVAPSRPPALLCCPRCHSPHLITLDLGQRTGGLIGAAGGAVSGVAGALSGAETGALVGAAAGPVGMALGTLAGALFGGLIGATTGGIAGARLGALVDETILHNIECQTCGHRFTPDP